MPAVREERFDADPPQADDDGPTVLAESPAGPEAEGFELSEDARLGPFVAEGGLAADGTVATDGALAADVEDGREALVSGARRAAIFVLSLEETVATQLLRCLSDEELGRIAAEIAELGVVDTDSVASVMEEFHELERLHGLVREGGLAHAARLVEQSFSPERARKVVRTLEATHQRLSFSFLASVDRDVLLSTLEEEHPQTVSVVLSHMVPQQAAELLECMETDRRQDLLERIAGLDGVSVEALRRIEKTLREQLEAACSEATPDPGGAKTVADILRASGEGGASLLDGLRRKCPELADEVDKHLFVFADVAQIERDALQPVLARLDNECLALALKDAAPELVSRVFESLPRRRVEAISETLESAGAVRVSEVQTARDEVVRMVKQLQVAEDVFLRATETEEEQLLY